MTVGIVGSLMMFVPVITVGINHHMTMVGHFRRLKDSPTLRFIVFSGMSYTAVSLQGSLTSLRSVNEVNHFTHYTIAHAHLGVYSFFSMAMFGALYYLLPRLTGREWASARLIKLHFWASAGGLALYWGPLTIGGWLQGLRMNNPDVPFLEIMTDTLPWLWGRTAAGTLMTLGHVVFAWLVVTMLRLARRPACRRDVADRGGEAMNRALWLYRALHGHRVVPGRAILDHQLRGLSRSGTINDARWPEGACSLAGRSTSV